MYAALAESYCHNVSKRPFELRKSRTDVFLLLVHVADLKPNVFLAQRARRVVHNVAETLSMVSIFFPTYE